MTLRLSQSAAILLVALSVHSPAATLYVDLNSTTPASPYATWTTASTTIQDAVDAAAPGDTVIVTNGTYATGGRALVGRMMNRVAVDKPLVLQSVNGPQFTVIAGYNAGVSSSTNVRCVYLTNCASLSGFTLTGGGTQGRFDSWETMGGGGVLCASSSVVVSNCYIMGNYGFAGGGACFGRLINCSLFGNSAYAGGGVCSNTLENCVLSNNKSSTYGGGAIWSTLSKCSVIGNRASNGGGVSGCTVTDCSIVGNEAQFAGGASACTLTNCTVAANSSLGSAGGVYASTLDSCIVYFNTASSNANYVFSSYHTNTFSYCCTTPQPTNGLGNITNEPLFLDLSVGNVRLQSNSPCINAGHNSGPLDGADLDGNPRVVGGACDMGAFEFQTPSSSIPYFWLQQYQLPLNGSVDSSDPDNDDLSNWQEWRCGTDPTNSLSLLKLLSVSNGDSGLTITWQSSQGFAYFVERRDDIASQTAFSLIQSNIVGLAGITSFSDTNSSGPSFYRVGVQ